MSEQTTTPDGAVAVAGDEVTTEQGRARGRRVWLWPSVAIAAAIVAGAGVYLAQRSNGLDEARVAYSEAVTLNEQARAALQTAVDGIGFTTEQCVADGGAPADCQALAQAVEAARAGLAEPFKAADAKDLDADSARSQAEALRATAKDFEAQAAQIKDATGKLNEQFEAATSAYLSGDAASFAASCEAATTTARGVESLAGEADGLAADCKSFAASEGSARLSVLKEKTAALQARVDALNNKVAAAQTPAAVPAPAVSSGGGSEATSGYSDSGYSATESRSSWSDSSYEAPAPEPAAPAPDPAPADNGGGWVDSGWTMDGPPVCSEGDTNGNSWFVPCP
ncbi:MULTISPECIES: hypothetical protein [Actinotignum]|uniref:hypothetical protein n=1 Tax=Actinotignum TaxID=1653174 RepID=UPI00237D7A79|nr:hypothetical protein [Actinotignum sanguinis]MDE1565781.1 hypothetical protein [Actinotignum sanguinis]MDK7197506.1 hypothetical protein [Actinotignum sanguinis]